MRKILVNMRIFIGFRFSEENERLVFPKAGSAAGQRLCRPQRRRRRQAWRRESGKKNYHKNNYGADAAIKAAVRWGYHGSDRRPVRKTRSG